MSQENSSHRNGSANHNRLDQRLSQLVDSSLTPEAQAELAGWACFGE